MEDAPTLAPTLRGSGSFFISDPHSPGTIYFVIVQHIILHANKDNNKLYQKSSHSQLSKRVILFSDPTFKNYIEVIKAEIRSKETVIIKELNSRWEIAKLMEEEEGEAERNEVQHQLENVKKSIEDLRAFLAEVSRVWKDWKDHIVSHALLHIRAGTFFFCHSM
jgi:hypothetical protein